MIQIGGMEMTENLPVSFAMDELKNSILSCINEKNMEIKLPPSLMEYVLFAVLADVRQNRLIETTITLMKGDEKNG